MTPIAKLNLKVFFQLFTVVVIVFLIGCYMRGNDLDKKEQEQKKEKNIESLTAYSNSDFPSEFALQYPEYKFKGDNKWNEEKYSLNLSNGGEFISGKGFISKSEVEMDLILFPNHQITGRYNNITRNVKLDVNGYIDEEGVIRIHLGHGSELSTLILRNEQNLSEQNIYKYKGEWGKKKLPSEIVFSLGEKEINNPQKD